MFSVLECICADRSSRHQVPTNISYILFLFFLSLTFSPVSWGLNKHTYLKITQISVVLTVASLLSIALSVVSSYPLLDNSSYDPQIGWVTKSGCSLRTFHLRRKIHASKKTMIIILLAGKT